MSTLTKHKRTVCVLLPNKEQLDITVGIKATGQDVFNSVTEHLGINDLHFFGLTVVKDNEHIFLDLEEKLVEYFSKEWKQEPGKVSQKRLFTLVLFLKIQFYVDNGILISEKKARRLYFSALRERVLRSECRQQEEVYFQLAGYALQADFGDHPLSREGAEVKPYFAPKDYFPPWIVAKRGENYLLCHGPKVHQELWGMCTRDAILCFIRDSCQLEDVPVTFYRLQKNKKEDRRTTLLGLTLWGMQVYQEVNNTRLLLYDFPWSSVGRLTFLGKKFEIQPDGLPSARKLVYYTGSSFRSRHLLLHLSSSHQLYLKLQPALKHLRQLEESKEKQYYRESYISDELDLDPPGSESSPGLSRRSTSSSGIEADTRQHSICAEMTSSEEDSQQHGERCMSSEASQDSACTSEFITGCKTHTGEEIRTRFGEGKEVLVDDPDQMFHLADLLEGVSVDCAEFYSKSLLQEDKGSFRLANSHNDGELSNKETLKDKLKSEVCLDWKNHSLDEDFHLQTPTRVGGTLTPDSSQNYSFNFPEAIRSNLLDEQSSSPLVQCPSKPSFYGRRSTNCLSLDLLGDDSFQEFIL